MADEQALTPQEDKLTPQEEKIIDMAQAYVLADDILNKKYLSELGNYQIVQLTEVDPELAKISPGDRARIFHIDRIIFDKEENNQEKLLNVYSALHNCGGSIILLVKSEGTQVDFYLGTRTDDVNLGQDILENSMAGNFSGSNLNLEKDSDINQIMSDIFDDKPATQTISAVTSAASFREGHTMKSGDFVQGFEKLLESVRGKKFTLAVIATPVSSEETALIRDGYEQLYTQLAPLAKAEITYGINESQAVTDSITNSFSEGVTKSIALTESHSTAKGKNWSTAKTIGTSHTEGTGYGINGSGQYSQANGNSTTKTISGSVSGKTGALVSLIAEVAVTVGGSVAKAVSVVNTLAGSLGMMGNKSESDTTFENTTGTEGGNLTENDQTGQTKTDAESLVKSLAKALATTVTKGTSQNRTIHFENRAIKSLLDRIDKQLERLDACADVGMWDSAAYIIADDANTSQLVASNYRALIRGKNSGVENSAVTVWSNPNQRQLLEPYLKRMVHPVLKAYSDSRISVTPAAMLSTEELTIAAGLPQKSLPGILVDEHASFGREVITFDSEPKGKLPIGKIYHMGQANNLDVALDIDKLTAHAFITGSTGAGKSNAIYNILKKFNSYGVPWLVIEPAKGEYKDVFGGYSNVTTYGTNPFKTPNLLQINPFSFPEDVHVLEHVDRLTEIFNACWPMYAAMPAILREAIEQSYEACGWSLKLSKNPGQFPTFDTLLKILPKVIDSSAYSADTSNDYKGALVTRVRSLTRGIHGAIFGDDISFGELLANPAIIDLSRIGSQETKSLIMGMLILKLQEFRMSEDTPANSQLRHVTILEEAHNLLKRTSTEQSQESSNLQGQSVAMISNAIAEMRTYGEGFIIADQSPALMDMSVIRNTNTKIILRLPERNDREIAGFSAGLNDVQIEELAKLERGVATVFQNDWTEPVLCKINAFTDDESLKNRFGTTTFDWQDKELLAIKKFLAAALEIEPKTFVAEEIERLNKWITSLNPDKVKKNIFEDVLLGRELSDSHKTVLLNTALGNVFEQAAQRKDFAAVAKKILSARFNVPTNSSLAESTEKIFAEVTLSGIR